MLRWTLAAGALLLAACSSDKSAKTSEGSAANTNKVQGNISVDNFSPGDFAWRKRVQLSRDTFGKWNVHTPEPIAGEHLKGKHPYLLVVDDGRFNAPQDPDPNTDDPTGLYPVPTQQSDSVTAVPDGTVLKAIGWTNKGQPVSDAHGGNGSPIWEKVVGHDGSTVWVPWVNVGYTALAKLHQLPQAATGS